jgi:hypothetical protein
MTRHLAQANVARQRAPLDSPEMAGFVVALDPVNRVAEASPGFVWRLRSSEAHGANPHLEGSGKSGVLRRRDWKSAAVDTPDPRSSVLTVSSA